MQFPGAVLLSLSRSRMLRCPATDWRPSRLLRAGVESTAIRGEAEAILKSCRTLEVPPYSRQEMEACLHYYSDRRWVNRGKRESLVTHISGHILSTCYRTDSNSTE